MPTAPEASQATGPAAGQPAARVRGTSGESEQGRLRAVLRLTLAVTGASGAALDLVDGERQVTSLTLGGNPPADDDLAGVRMHESAPLRAGDGTAIGTVRVWDEQRRALTAEQSAQLADLADIASALVDRHRALQATTALAEAAEDARRTTEQAHAALSRARAFDRALFDALSVGVIAADTSGTTTHVNRVLAGWAGEGWNGGEVPPGDLIEELYLADGVTLLDPEDAPIARALRGEPVRDVELVAGPPGGPRRVSLSTAEMIRDDDGAVLGTVVTITDITAQRALEQQLREAALHDPLTGLPNRALLMDRIEQALHAQRRHGTPAAVVYCDLDGFKEINDTQGHAAGDAALVRAAQALRRAVRPGDTVARIGGDEFVVLCPGIGTAAEAEDLVGRIDAALAADGGTLRASSGQALSHPGDCARTILRRADEAMYVVKRARR